MRKLATAYALSGSLIARQLSHRESQGRLRRRICADLPSAQGGQRPPNLVHHPPNYRPLSRYVGTFNAAYPGWGFFRGIFCTSIRFFPTSWVTALPWFT